MSEIRKKLSDIQFRLLLDAQVKYNEGVQSLGLLETNLRQVRALVFDSLGLPLDSNIQIDVNAQELVIQINDVDEEDDKDK